VRVAIAEDEPVYRAGLVRLLQAAGIEIAYEAANGDQLIAHLNRGDLPDVAIMDIRMAGNDDDGLRAAEHVTTHYPEIGVLLLSAYPEAAYANRLFASGSAGKGYMLKETLNTVSLLIGALERVSRNLTYCDPKIIDQLVAQKTGAHPRDLLSPRELQILELLASGASNDAIITATSSTPGAIESSLGRIYTKLRLPRGSEYNPRVLAVLRWLNDPV